ncbi:MAG: hypothetical protein D6698_03870 [Gammaproteobacteria bacterium]|nr:MAG: hypothetical protein D6698_03870 [Gammaproteobacteria bacterium]
MGDYLFNKYVLIMFSYYTTLAEKNTTMGALMAEIHEEWQGRRCLVSMSEFHEWRQVQKPSSMEKEKVVTIDH